MKKISGFRAEKVILFSGLIVSIFISYFLYKENEREDFHQFSDIINTNTLTFTNKIEANKVVLESVASFYYSSNFVDREEFKTFVTPLLKRYPFIKALKQIPKIPFKDKKKFINLAKKDGFKNFKLTEKSFGSFVSINTRAYYYPVYYVEPLSGNEKAFGFDLGSDEARLKNIELAMKTGEATATKLVKLVQDYSSLNGFLIFHPVYSSLSDLELKNESERFEKLKGFILSIYLVKDMINQTIVPHIPSRVKFKIFDTVENYNNVLFNNSYKNKGYLKKTEVDVGGRIWHIHQSGMGNYQNNLKKVYFTLLGFVIYAIFYFLSKLLRLYRERTKQVEKEVQKRTLKLQRAESVKSEFLANMSHEIRTPLNGVLGMVQLLKKTKLDKEQMDMINTISSSGESLMTILNDILDFSKINAGKVEVDNVIFNLKEALEDSLNLMIFSAQSKGLDLYVQNIEDLDVYFKNNVTRIKQIITNFISNSIKFTKMDEVFVYIIIRDLDKENANISIHVKDTNTGIPYKSQSKLFVAFSQTDTSITRKFRGTGLGLSISSGLAKIMNGSVGFSNAEGAGSDFYLKVPLVKVDPSTIKTHKDKSIQIEHDQKILIVDDNKVNQKVAKMMLNKIGIECDLASNGVEAVEACDNYQYSIILMDMQMPVLDGIDATKKILAKHTENPPKIIAMTANAFEEDKEKCLNAGMVEFISKPMQLDKVMDVLSKVLN